MSSFSDYMDQIKAGRDLKIHTEAYVLREMQNKNACKKSIIKQNTGLRNIYITAMSTAACLILVLISYTLYNTPINYVCIDINPSVELGINLFDKVVSAEAYNEDGSRLLGVNEADIKYLQVSDAVKVIVTEAAELGYIAEDGSTVIALTAESKRGETALKLSDKSEDAANTALNTDSISAVVYADCSDIELRKEAEEAGISPGKYKLILALQSLDSNINIEDYKNAKVSDIITRADLISSHLEQLGKSVTKTAELEKIQDAATKVKKVKEGKNNEEKENQAPKSSAEEQVYNSADYKGEQESSNNIIQKDTEKNKINPDQNKDINKEKGKDKGSAGTDKKEGKHNEPKEKKIEKGTKNK